MRVFRPKTQSSKATHAHPHLPYNTVAKPPSPAVRPPASQHTSLAQRSWKKRKEKTSATERRVSYKDEQFWTSPTTHASTTLAVYRESTPAPRADGSSPASTSSRRTSLRKTATSSWPNDIPYQAKPSVTQGSAEAPHRGQHCDMADGGSSPTHTPPTTTSTIAQRLFAAKPLTWRGQGELPQFPWPQPYQGLVPVIDMWSGIGGLLVALLALGIRCVALSADRTSPPSPPSRSTSHTQCTSVR